MYDPIIGRFITPDTIVQNFSDPQTLNRYTYCGNSPLMYVDPNGHIFLIDDIIIGAIIGAAIGGITSAITGGDIGTGMLTGAISGAFFGAAGGIIQAAGLEGTMAAAGIHAVAGAAAGGINASITGGDVGLGIVTGGVAGGFGEFAGAKIIPSFEDKIANFASHLIGRSITGGITGGVASEIYGGSFGEGFGQGAWTGAFGFICNETVHAFVLPNVRPYFKKFGQWLSKNFTSLNNDSLIVNEMAKDFWEGTLPTVPSDPIQSGLGFAASGFDPTSFFSVNPMGGAVNMFKGPLSRYENKINSIPNSYDQARNWIWFNNRLHRPLSGR